MSEQFESMSVIELRQKAKEMGLQLQNMTLAQMDELWNEAKQGERQ